MNFIKHSWVEINIDNALYNWKKIVSFANGRAVMPVVKADAYGHGADFLTKLYENNGAEAFAVSNINEAIKLRKNGITKTILVLGFTPTDYVDQLHEYNITQAIYCKEYAKCLSDIATRKNYNINVHLKVDTGMCRVGFNCRNDALFSIDDILYCLSLPALNYEGIFMHFSSADSQDPDDVLFSDNQYARFNEIISALKTNGHDFKYIHCCNSAASLLRNNNEGNLIRPGIILFGVSPSYKLDLGYTPKPIMKVMSTVSMVKKIDANECVGYGRTFVSNKEMTIATVAIGYADGYPRKMSNNGHVIINGKYAPVVGRVCMDQMTVDISEIENVTIGTPVTVIGCDGDLEVSFDEIAEACGTIAYEIVCDISVRMPRVYISAGEAKDVKYLGGLL